MAQKEFYLGSVGPLLYDDEEGTLPAIRTNGRITREEDDVPTIIVSDQNPSGSKPENTMWLKTD